MAGSINLKTEVMARTLANRGKEWSPYQLYLWGRLMRGLQPFGASPVAILAIFGGSAPIWIVQ